MSEQLIVYAVKTTCGRNFTWPGFDEEHLKRSLAFHNYEAESIELYVPYIPESVKLQQKEARRTA